MRLPSLPLKYIPILREYFGASIIRKGYSRIRFISLINMMRILTIFTFLLFCTVHAQELSFRNFNVENGLGQSQVYALHKNNDGTIWMGTRGAGISIYNGYEFRQLDLKDGLPNNFVNCFESDEEGTIWIGTEKGLCIYKNDSLEFIHLLDGEVSIRDLSYTNQRMYCATNKGVFAIDLTQNAVQVIDHHSANTVYATNSMHILIGTNDGLLGFINNRLVNYASTSRFMKNAISCITRDKEGVYWIGTFGDGAYCYNQKSFYRVDKGQEFKSKSILDIYLDKDGKIILGTLNHGVYMYTPKTKIIHQITSNEGLSNNHVRSITQDSSGDLWFGTSGGGVNQYLGEQFTFYNENTGLNGHYIYAIHRDQMNRLWVANGQKGISIISDSIEFLDRENGFYDIKVKAFAEDKMGRMWIGTEGKGVFSYWNGEFESIPEMNNAYVKQMTRDNWGNIWIATSGTGIFKINPTSLRITQFTTLNGLLSNRITTIFTDYSGNIWYGTSNQGLAQISKNGKQLLHFNTENGLNSNDIRTITEDAENNILIGTAGAGLNRLFISSNYQKSQSITTNEGLSSDNIYLITVDQDENVVIGTERGIETIFFNSDQSVSKIKSFGKLEGFSGVESCQNSVWKDNDGTLWIGTINGLCRFNHKQYVVNEMPPQLSLLDVKLNYVSLRNHPNISSIKANDSIPTKLNHEENNLIFEFIGINLRNPQKVNYRWKLVGFDESWSPLSKERSIQYSNIPPGKYEFRVQAQNEDGFWTQNDLIYTFEIDRPFYFKPWFIVLGSIAILLLLYGSYKLVVYRTTVREKRVQKELKLENELINLEQQALRLQMNPHFIFNALNSIQSLIGSGQEKDARYYLAKFSRLMRQILDNSRKSSINLDEEIQFIENYLMVEQFCNGNRFEYVIKIDEQLDTDFIILPPMLIQPFIENAIKHGMKEKKSDDKGLIQIEFNLENDLLVCSVKDNGIGRKKSAEINQNSKETYHHSTGLKVTRERLSNFDKEKTSLEIIDLYNEKNEAQGTKIIIKIPIE